jgi:putative CocE/NonD family hydrolase
MKTILALAATASLLAMALPSLAQTTAPAATTLPSETPDVFKPAASRLDYERREVMIPMRDGVKLHTVILIPKGAARAPMLLTRTPYDASAMTSINATTHLAGVLADYDHPTDVVIEGGYIRVVQDIRGKHGSEGDYVMNRPLKGPLNPTQVDHATDTWDTIDWLVKNTPESNGKVGILGISYDGFTSLEALFNPHPALKVAVPMNPMVNGWMGDDWFHNGAFRQQNMPYIYEQVGTRKNEEKWLSGVHDDYDLYMRAGSAGALGAQMGLEQTGFWRKVLAHPDYDAFWSEQAVDKLLAKEPLKVPVMLVHGLWDQEDIYGATAVYKALEPKDAGNDKVFLVLGPWNHGQQIHEASSLGAIKFSADTALQFRQDVLGPFLAHYLKDDAPAMDVAPVTAFETGSNRWRKLDAWPSGCAKGCTATPTPLYLHAGAKADFTAPKAGEIASDAYVSDPAKPVPYRARPSQPTGYVPPLTWTEWLVDDQREASGRTDVLTFTTDVLTAPLKISGEPVVHLTASTTGTDSDWVVKLIDVYPDEVPSDPGMGGYQLPVAMDILRGRYREGFTEAKPIKANAPLGYRFALPNANHVFLPGHRIMVQVQSSWFPLYDRNPQTFTPNIFLAKPADYVKATQTVFHAADKASYVELPVVKGP